MNVVNKLGHSYNSYTDMVENFIQVESNNLDITTLQNVLLTEQLENEKVYGHTQRIIYNGVPTSNISLAKVLFKETNIKIKNTIIHELYHVKFFERTYKLIDYNLIYTLSNKPQTIQDYVFLIGFKAIDEFYATHNAGKRYFCKSISASHINYPSVLINMYAQTIEAYRECLNIGVQPKMLHMFPIIDEYVSWIVECISQSKFNDDIGTQSMNLMLNNEVIGYYVKRVTENIIDTYNRNLFTQDACIKCGEVIFSIMQELGCCPVVDSDGIMTLKPLN